MDFTQGTIIIKYQQRIISHSLSRYQRRKKTGIVGQLHLVRLSCRCYFNCDIPGSRNERLYQHSRLCHMGTQHVVRIGSF